jgi:glycosyltransferase involved in cell wall biosynthesis
MSAPLAVLHVARNPRTGVWSLIRTLAMWQKAQGYRVGIGLLLPPDWRPTHDAQLNDLRAEGFDIFEASSLDLPGTLAFAGHQFINPVSAWARSFSNRHPCHATTLHFHNAWLSGVFMPVKAPVSAVATYHGIAGARTLERQPVRRRLHGYWARRFPRYGGRLASVDAPNTNVAEKLFGVPAALFTVIPNGSPPAPEGRVGGPRVRDTGEPLTLGHVGVIDNGKGWRITAEAVERMRAQGLPVRLLIAGHGADAQAAADWCRADPARGSYLGFSTNPLTEVFPNIDALVLPSLSEGMPMAVLEALAFGAPVLSTPVGGLPDVIEHSANGFIIDRSPESIMESSARLLDPACLTEMASRAQDSHARRFSTKAMGEAYAELYAQAHIAAFGKGFRKVIRPMAQTEKSVH